ncbi:molybdopterin synthase sulfur carrier subunit [Physcia stellaris]|nr:molybdopterin synthase sulfur carrier subunit [Physcia stellaris]
MLPPFDYFEHRRDCQRKQLERTTRIANLPAAYHGPVSRADREILEKPVENLVQDVHKHTLKPIDILRTYGKLAIKAHAETNCLTEVMIHAAERWADSEINLKGPLAGIPVSLKDSVAVGGFDDGIMVKLLKDAGAIPYVKTNLPVTLLSFESTNDVWGRCTNPHNPNYSPGGSTGGEGALLAYGGVAFTPYDVQPVISMKPWEYDHSVHPIAWQSALEQHTREKAKFKIGVLHSDGVVEPSPACARALDMVVSALQSEGHEIVDVDPPSPYEALVIGSNLLNSDGCRTFRSFFRTGEWNDPGAAQMSLYMGIPKPFKFLYYLWVRYIRQDAIWAGLLANFHEKSAFEQWKWVAKREAYKAEWHDWWQNEAKLDFMLTPPNATPAVPHAGMKDAVSSCGYTFLFNLLDYPAGIIPVTKVDKALDRLPSDFRSKSLNGVANGAYKHYNAMSMHGLPVAVQIIGQRLQEEKVLAVMERIEAALDKHSGKYQLLEIE